MKKEAEQTVENLEKRNSARIDQTSSAQIKDLQSGKIHKVKVFNYSKEGVYFESDIDLKPGSRIYIGIQNSPYGSLPDVLEYYRAKIMWQKKLKRSFFRFGYGVKFISLDKKQDLKNDRKKSRDLRKHPRRKYNKSTMFMTRDGIFEGLIKNISPSGAFVMAKSAFKVGQILTLSLPFKNGKETKVKGEIVWMNDEGFGLKFLSID
jgi:hypothetical protein